MPLLNLTKGQCQGAPYLWDYWTTRGTRSVASKAIGSSRFSLEADNDTALASKISSHESERNVKGLGPR